MARIGFSGRRTIAYLYGWTLMLAGIALALRFVPYSDHKGHFNVRWTAVMLVLGVLGVAASVYLVYVLEILKFRRVATARLMRLRPNASAAEIERDVIRDFETGEMQAITLPAADSDGAGPRRSADAKRAASPEGAGSDGAAGSDARPQQRFGDRQPDRDRVGAEQQHG